MSSVENINKDLWKYIPAVTHVDGTGRVQTVSKDINPNFHNLIKAFYKISKVPILLNTSFNENEPIVMKPSHAINCFLRTRNGRISYQQYINNKIMLGFRNYWKCDNHCF